MESIMRFMILIAMLGLAACSDGAGAHATVEVHGTGDSGGASVVVAWQGGASIWEWLVPRRGIVREWLSSD